MKVIALIVAAGRGSRSGQTRPKQYVELGGKAILRHTVEAFLDHPRIDGIKVVIHPDDMAAYEQAMTGLDLLPPAMGRAERQGSVLAGLEDLAPEAPDYILIHDAARPFCTGALIERAVAALAEHDAALPVLPVVDTVREVASDGKSVILERGRLRLAQTPQAFHYDAILRAHRLYETEPVTDDIALAERAGLDIVYLAGDSDNFKITTAEDVEKARTMLKTKLTDIRTGMGYDVHAFADGADLWLGGIKINHSRGLKGHSDADVALHALTDALLGAIGAGDIGVHFPPGAEQWKNAASERFLAHARNLINELGGLISHVDVTIICESPKISPYRDQMRARIAEILQIAPARVSIKGTTTEKLGFTGRGEGIAAEAVATVRLPE